MADRVVIVTGGFGVLGQAVALEWLAGGSTVCVLGRRSGSHPAVDALGQAGACALTGVDVADAAAASDAVADIESRFGRIDVLVNAAGAFKWTRVEDSAEADWADLWRANLRTALVMSRAVLPALRRTATGRIVNVGAAGALEAASGMGLYAASKAAVLKLTEAMARELHADGITVNAVLPTIIDTPANRRDMPDADHARWVTPAALAKIIAFLASPDAQAITGAGIPVRGGVF